jgi:hypothetical protein
MQHIVTNYEILLGNIDVLIKHSNYKVDFLIKSLGLSRATFYQKRKKHTFTVPEMKKLLTYIDNEELEDKLFGNHMDLALKEPRMTAEETKNMFDAI